MRILNINSYYYSSTVHNQLQKSLFDKGVDTVTYVPLAKGYIPREECKYGNEVNIESYECYSSADRFIFHLKHKKILKNILEKIKIQQFHYSHAHSLFSNGYIALQLKKKFNIPYIVSVRDTDVNTFFKYMVHLRRLGLEILNEAEKIVFLSTSYKEYLINQYVPLEYRGELMEKSKVIPNGIDQFWLHNKSYPKELPQRETLRFVYVGVINRRKNLTTTIKAIEMLQKHGYKIEFTVVGRIEDRSIFESIRKSPFVHYLEPLPKEKLKDIYMDNDIFVMPSITETFGLTYAEAMSQGLPVIYSKGQGFDGQFQEGVVGHSVISHSAEEIVKRVRDIMNNYESISKNCIDNVGKFDWGKIALEYCNECYLVNSEYGKRLSINL